MVGVLVRLKLRLLRAGLAASGIRGVLGGVFALIVALLVGATGGVAFFLVRFVGDNRTATDATAAGLALVLVVWVLGPIVAAGAEGTLEADRLALFPLRREQLMPGLLAAALVGFGGLCTAVVLAGAVAGMAPPSPLAVITVLAAACHLALCAAASRCVSTAVSGAARSRRWRDVVLFAGPVLALGLNVGLQLVSRSVAPAGGTTAAGGLHGSHTLDIALSIVRVLPSAPAALAMGFARQGRVLAALAALAVAAVLPVVVLALWGRVLERVLTTGGGGAGTRLGRRDRPLLPRWLPVLRPGPVGAIAAKELRLTWRDPRQRAAMISTLFAGLVPAISLRVLSSTNPRIVLAAALPAYVLGANTTNLFGFDGQAHWTNVAAGDGARRDLYGKCLARLLITAPLVTLVAAGLVARTGSARYAFAALGLAGAGFGVNLGLGALASVFAPFPLPDNAANVFSAGNTGRGLAAAGPALGVLFGGMLLLAPVLVPMLIVSGTARITGVGLAGLWYGAVGWRLLAGAAVRHAQPRQPELLEALERRHAG